MFRPTGFSDLAGHRVGIYGYGVEGRATAAKLAEFDVTVVVVDDAPSEAGVLATDEGGLEALLECDIVLKSPGISPLSPTIARLREAGVPLTSALNLWLTPEVRGRVIGVTGTKGKSTTTSLITFFLTALGESATAVGNIGAPPYDPPADVSEGWLVLEMSSFQCVDVTTAPAIIVLTALGSDHLDWHGSLEQYRHDKLSITRAAGEHVTLVADSPTLRQYTDVLGGEVQFVTPDDSRLSSALHLLGDHSRSNVALALAAVARATNRSIEAVREAVVAAADSFVPLPGRLTPLGTIDGVRFVDDGLATSSLPTIAALAVFANEPVTLIVGGFDRGVDYGVLADALAQRTTLTTVVAMGPAGRRMAEAIRLAAPTMTVHDVATMADAVAVAKAESAPGSVVLFSPAAPSFDQYRNWRERSEDFARLVASTA